MRLAVGMLVLSCLVSIGGCAIVAGLAGKTNEEDRAPAAAGRAGETTEEAISPASADRGVGTGEEELAPASADGAVGTGEEARSPAAAETSEEALAPAGSCVDQLRRRLAAANADEVCRILTKGRDPRAGANLDAFSFREQDAGDGSTVHVFEHPPGGDAYAYRPSYHFGRRGDRLALVFDGEGLPVRYATDRHRVNGRWQIERSSVADIPGLYRKRSIETWFWNGSEYVRAFSRVTIEGAKDASLNGSELVWNPESEEFYKSTAPSWTYRVQQGDTLSAIARRKGVSIREIQRQNGIRDAGSLRLGQVIRYEGWRVNVR